MAEQNLNNAQSQNWLLAIGNYDSVSFKSKNFTLPTVSCGTTNLGGTSIRQFETVGDHLILDDLTFEFHIDSDYRNYEAVYNWIVKNVKDDLITYEDVTIELLDANGHSTGLQIVYVDCWPTMLAAVPLDSENADTDLQATVVFKYTEFYFQRRSIEL